MNRSMNDDNRSEWLEGLEDQLRNLPLEAPPGMEDMLYRAGWAAAIHTQATEAATRNRTRTAGLWKSYLFGALSGVTAATASFVVLTSWQQPSHVPELAGERTAIGERKTSVSENGAIPVNDKRLEAFTGLNRKSELNSFSSLSSSPLRDGANFIAQIAAVRSTRYDEPGQLDAAIDLYNRQKERVDAFPSLRSRPPISSF